MPQEAIVNAFSAGELSPSVYGRTDLNQYTQAAASLKNMIVLPSGSARKRPGTQKLDTITNTTEITDFGRLGAFQMDAETGEAILVTSEIIRSYDSSGNVGLDTTPPVTVTADRAKSIKSVQTKLDGVYVGRDFRPYRITNSGGSLTGPNSIAIIEPRGLGLTFDVSSANGHPGAVAAIDERIVVGGTNLEPNAIFGSAIKALDNFIAGARWAAGQTSITYEGVSLTIKAGDFFPQDYDPSFTKSSCGTTSGSATITVPDKNNIFVNMQVTGSGVPAGSYIASISSSSNEITISQNATATASVTLTFNHPDDMNFFANPNGDADTAPYAFSILDNAFIDIYWMLSTNTVQSGFLLLGTPEGVYAVIGSGTNGSITPGSILSARKLSASGCADVQGIIAGSFIIFVDSSKRRLRVAQFSLEADAFSTPRLNDLADHLFDADIKEIHYQRAPNDVLWVLLDNGKLLSFSYDASGSLSAWTPMEFGNDDVTVTVESMTILHEGSEDVIVLLMKSVNGSTTTWTIEKMMPINETNQDEFWFVDSGVRTYNATAFTTVSGLDHLEGETVKVWADGAAHPDVTVTSGQVTLNREVNTAIIGRGYTARVQTLPIQQQQDKVKRASRAFVRFLNTIGAKAGDDEFEEIIPFMEGNFLLGSKPSQFSGIKEVPYSGRYENDAQVNIFSDAPTPFHVLSVTTRLEIYG